MDKTLPPEPDVAGKGALITFRVCLFIALIVFILNQMLAIQPIAQFFTKINIPYTTPQKHLGDVIAACVSTFTILTALSGLYYLTTIAPKIYSNVMANRRVFEAGKAYILDPNDMEDFQSIFVNAQDVIAYNPPFTLLKERQDHRLLLFSLLKDSIRSYRLLAGIESIRRLQFSVKSTLAFPGLDLALKKFQIKLYDSNHGLHTHFRPGSWDKMGDVPDYRGLSYFLITTPEGRRIIILYLISSPFVRSFSVPVKAFKIVDDLELFNSMKQDFEERWQACDTNEIGGEWLKDGNSLPPDTGPPLPA